MANWEAVKGVVRLLRDDITFVEDRTNRQDAGAMQAEMRAIRARLSQLDGLTYHLAQESVKVRPEATGVHPTTWLPLYLSKRDMSRALSHIMRGERFHIFLRPEGMPGKPGVQWIVCAAGIHIKAFSSQGTARRVAVGLNELSRNGDMGNERRIG